MNPLPPQRSLGFVEDNPINDASDDKLNYALYASELALKLNQSSFKNSFAVGITGEWGTGKTSFINLVKSILDDSKFIKIDFNAWDSHSPKAIIKDFFTTLTSSLSKYHSDISTLLLNYSETLIKSYDPIISSLLSPISNDLKSKSIFEQRTNIEKAIPKIPKRIVICIDELDRLDKKELIEVIKLIRSTANFPNVIFIVSYDRNYLIEAIRKLNKQNSESFLEKIFQIEITLPYFGISSLQELMYGKLRSLIEPESHEEIKKVIWDQIFFRPPHYAGHIATIRDVTRLINSLVFHFDLLKNEVSLHDLFYLEILRVKYPSVYELLGRMHDTFLHQTDGLDINQAFILKTVSPSDIVIFKHIKNNCSGLSIKKNQIEKIESLLRLLFSDKQFAEENRLAIKYPSNFFKYFAYRLLPNHLSEAEFETARKGDQETFNSFIEKSVKGDLHAALTRRLKQIQKFDSKVDFERIINGIFFLAQQEVVSKSWSSNSVGYDAPYLAYKLSNSYHSLDRLYEGNQEEANTFIVNKFKEAKPPFLNEAEAIRGMLAIMVDDEYIIAKTQLTEILLGYLRDYLKSVDQVDRNAWFLYQNCEVKIFIKDSSRNYIPQSSMVTGSSDAIISFISEKNLHGFLNSLILLNQRDPEYSENQHFAVWDIVVKIFGSWEEFYQFLITFNSQNIDYVTEFLVFYNKCKDAGFGTYIPFEFEHFKK